MWKEALLLIVVIGYVTSQSGQVNEDDKAIDDAAGGSDNPVDVPLNEETDAATDALANFMGFTCPKGHRCLPVLDCLPCDYGTYKDSEGSDLCQKCPPDCTTLRKGAQSREECVPFCPPGYEISECGKTCTKCRPGTYKSTWEKTSLCMQCPAGSNPLADKLGLNSESQCYAEDEPISATTTDDSLTTHLPPTVPIVTVTCQSASDCGFGGACYNGYCGCLTTSCSKLHVAYAAMPGCQHFCQCEITTQTWRLHSCNVHELFDEKIDNCNWDYNVETDLCYSTVNCELDTCAPPASAGICSYNSRKYMTCLRNLHAQCNRSPINELSTASGQINADLYSKLMDLLSPITTFGGMESVYDDYMLQCLEGEPITPTDDFMTTHSPHPAQYSTDHNTETTTDPSLPPSVPTVTVTCQSASDCGFGGACYNGFCGCQTTSCSRLAYAAMPGCEHFCQCEITTQTWRLHSCNVHELFDEKIDNCNWDYNVESDLCFSSVNCETGYCPPPPRPTPPASADICSYDSRKYVTCLRSLYAQCSYRPVSYLSSVSEDIDADLYTELVALLSPITTVDGMERVYNDYVLQCLDDHSAPTTTTPGATETTTTRRPTTLTEIGACPISCPLPPSEESNLCSASVDQYFTCLDVCSTDAANVLFKDYMNLHSDIRSHLTPFLNNGDSWDHIYAWYLNECPAEEPTTGTPLTTQKSSTVKTSPVRCQSAPECGPAGDCFGGYCGCLTSTCSDLAYVAMPGCGHFCQCETTTQMWRLHSCNSHELFDERINNCNWNFSVAEDLCFSTVNCELDTCPLPSSANPCSIDTRTYMTCLRSFYVQCGRNPADELASAANQIDTVLYGELTALVGTVETVADMESVYYSYMYQCLAGIGG